MWDNLKEFHVVVIDKLADSKFVWSGKTVHYLLCRQLRVYKKDIWCLVVDRTFRFSLHKFGEITRLNTDPLPTENFEHEPHLYKAFWKELNVSLGYGPKLDELKPVLGLSNLEF